MWLQTLATFKNLKAHFYVIIYELWKIVTDETHGGKVTANKM
jgi:hypothetical protein